VDESFFLRLTQATFERHVFFGQLESFLQQP
jgi:hypothetical protein